MTLLAERSRLARIAGLHARRARRLHTELNRVGRAVVEAARRCETCQARLAGLRTERSALVAWKRAHAGTDALRWRETVQQREAGLDAAIVQACEALQQAAQAYEEAVAERNRAARAYRRASESETESRLRLARIEARLLTRDEDRTADEMIAGRHAAGPALQGSD